MKAYWITLCQVTDDKGYGEYIKLAGPAIEKFGGKFQGFVNALVADHSCSDYLSCDAARTSLGEPTLSLILST